MRVIKINAKDVFDDNNEGYIFGLEEADLDFPDYVEWFKSEAEREKVIKENNFEVVE